MEVEWHVNAAGVEWHVNAAGHHVGYLRGRTLLVQPMGRRGYQASVSGYPVLNPSSGKLLVTRSLDQIKARAIIDAEGLPLLDRRTIEIITGLRNGSVIMGTTPPSEWEITRSVMSRIAMALERKVL